MKGACGNIYKTARRAAGLTQEQAAEQLYISVRSIAEYESGRTIPPDDVVCRMVDLYGDRSLAYLHLKQSTEVGRRYLPDLHILDLPRSNRQSKLICGSTGLKRAIGYEQEKED